MIMLKALQDFIRFMR